MAYLLVIEGMQRKRAGQQSNGVITALSAFAAICPIC
jgi:hypothetical protein